MKRTSLIALFLVFVMLLGVCLTACGGGGNNEETKAETTPGETEPAGTEPAETKPAETEPEATEPGETEPEQTEPAETEPTETEPEETEPEETEPEETEPQLITVDVSGLSFNDLTVAFTGETFTLTVAGLETLPDGVTVAYKDNEASKVGEYKAKATFTVPEGYAPVAAMNATLTITAPTIVEGALTYVDEDKTFLYQLNPSLTSLSFAIPANVTRIAENAIYGLKNLATLYVPATVTQIDDHAFGYKLKYGVPAVNKDFVVYGVAGSAAEAYCTKNGITFKTEDPTVHVKSVDDLYTTDGLVLWLDAFDPTNSTVDLANGKWYSKLDNTKYATFVANAGVTWVARAHGVGYNILSSNDRSEGAGKNGGATRNTYLDLGASLVAINDADGYTLEYIGAMYGCYDGTNLIDDHGYDTNASTNRFGAWAEWIFDVMGGAGVRISYVNNNGYTGNWGHGDFWISATTPIYSDRVVKGFSQVITNTETGTTMTSYSNGAVGKTTSVTFGATITAGKATINQASADTATAFYLFRQTACTVMAVRVYDRALTADEVKMNHLADLCAFFDLDLSIMDGIFKEDFDTIVSALAAFDFNASKEEIQKVLDTALKPQYSATMTVECVDETGKVLSTTKITKLTGDPYYVTAPAVSGYYTRDLFVTGTMGEADKIQITYKKLPSGITTSELVKCLPGIACWGDSITAGAGGGNLDAANSLGIDLIALGGLATGGGYVAVLQNLVKTRLASVTVTNCGVGGETSAVIAARAGTEHWYLYLGKEAKLTGKSVVIDIQQNAPANSRLGILRQGEGNSINPVKLTGTDANGQPVTVQGSISMSVASGQTGSTCDYQYLTYTFTRTDNSTDEVTFAANTPIVNYGTYAYDGKWCTIFIGQNGGYSSIDELIQQQEEILEACQCDTNFIIISLSSGGASDRAAMETAMAAKWGDHFMSARAALSCRAAYDRAGVPASSIADNTANISTGVVPGIFLSDGVHLNAVGYALLGNAIFEKMWTLGYFDPLFDYYDSLQK